MPYLRGQFFLTFKIKEVGPFYFLNLPIERTTIENEYLIAVFYNHRM